MTTVRLALARQLDLFATLRYRNFRLFWLGLVAQVTGQQMTMVTLGWLAFDLTGSPLTLGYVNLMLGVPMIAVSLLGGALADRMDQRLIIGAAQVTSAVLLGAVAALTFTGLIEVWHLLVGSFLIGLARGFDEPSRQALFPALLPDRSLIAQAVPLISLAWQVNRIAAPSVAGFVIAAAGAESSFAMAAAGSAIMAIVVGLLRIDRVRTTPRGNVLANIVEGARYAWGHSIFRVIIGAAFITSIFVLGYMLMMPVFADAVHGVGPAGLGIMYTVPGIGAIVSLFTVSPLMRAFPAGHVVTGGLIGFALAIIGFALMPWFFGALAMLVICGYFQNLFLSSSQIVLQSLVPDELRGRVMGLHGMLWSIVPLGGALLNAIANFTGAPAALAGGGALVLAFALLVMTVNRALRSVTLPRGERTGRQA